jgi:hypothetical protein
MPINYNDYPPNWKTEIVPAVRKRSGDRCELCFAPNKTIVLRDQITGQWRTLRIPYDKDLWREVKIVLTVHHIDGEKTNNKMVNLLHLCQRCHLRLDLERHLNKRMKIKYQYKFQAYRAGKAFQLWTQFVLSCTQGKSVLYYAKDYIGMDMKSYKKLIKRSKK